VNLEEVTRLAGVSSSTVSRVVNDQSYMHVAVHRGVLDIMREQNYQVAGLIGTAQGVDDPMPSCLQAGPVPLVLVGRHPRCLAMNADGHTILQPPISTIHQPIADLGRDAVNILLDLPEHTAQGPQHRLLDTQLILRGSYGCLEPAGKSAQGGDAGTLQAI
jgi:hypothetical protein